MNRSFLSAANCRHLILFILATGFTFSGPSQAQPPIIPYRIGDAIKDAQPPRRPEVREAPEPEIIEQDTRPLNLAKGETLMVREFRLEGAEHIPEAELQAALAAYKGRMLDMAEIQAAAVKLTGLYRSRGYLVARAYVLRQDATSGVLTIRIIVGKYGELTLKNESLVSNDKLLNIFTPLQEEKAISRNDLERAMLLVDDMPGAAMPKLTIARSKTFGSSDFNIAVPKDKLIQGYLLGDNLGSRYTGAYRLSGGASLNSPFGFADQLNLRGMVSEHTGLVNGGVAYNFPLMSNGLRAEVAANVTTYELGSVYANLNAKGDAYYFDASLSYPLLRSRDKNLYLSMGLTKKLLRDVIGALNQASSREANTGAIGFHHDRWDSLFGMGVSSYLASGFTFGSLQFNDAKQQALNKAGADTGGTYGRFNIDFAATLELAPLWILNTTAGLQKALLGKNLDSVEQMNLTCSSCGGVKVFSESVTGDNGYKIGTELRYTLPGLAGIRHAMGVFADTGYVYVERSGYTLYNSFQLSDIGAGYYAGWGAFNSLVQFTHSIGPIPSAVANTEDYRVRAQIGLSF